jgi:uncharacterized protein (TIGR02145 family)
MLPGKIQAQASVVIIIERSYYNNDSASNAGIYGALYNWWAVNDSRKLCPAGWHVPADDEWTILIDYLGGASVAGGKLKETGTTLWSSPNTGATNESGFTALPAGDCDINGAFWDIGKDAYIWSSTENISRNAWIRELGFTHSEVYRNAYNKGDEISVRCLMDSEDHYSLTIRDANVYEDDTVEVQISTGNLTPEDDIISYQFDIEFDTAALDYIGNTITGTLAEGGMVMVNAGPPAKLAIGYMGTNAITGAGDILILRFKALKVGTTTLTMTNSYLNDSVVNNLTNGTVKIFENIAPTAAITYNDSDIRCGDALLITAAFSEPMKEVNPVRLSLGGAITLSAVDMTRISSLVYTYTWLVPKIHGLVNVTLSNGTDMAGNEVVSTPTRGGSFTVIPIHYGDVDDNRKILTYDAALTLRYSVGLDPLPDVDPVPWDNWRDTTANVDGVGGVTANDAAEILKYSIGLITQFPAESGMKAAYEPYADVGIAVADGNVVFKSFGELFGLNVFVHKDNECLGSPLFLNESLLTATNITATKYAIGVCTATAMAEGAEIIRVPYKVTSTKSITFDLIVNTLEKQVTIDLSTGTAVNKENDLVFYPNPAKTTLYFATDYPDARIAIYDVYGRIVEGKQIKNNKVDISKLGSGIYLLRIATGNKVVSGRFVKE